MMTMSDIDTDERRRLLSEGRALPPDPGRFPLRPGNADDISNAAHDVNRIDDAERSEVRAHITKWAVHDGTTEALPDSWHIVRKEDS